MSTQTRDKPTTLTVCDLCDKEIADHHKDGGYEYGSLMHGQGGRARPAESTTKVTLWWDPRTWPGRRHHQVRQWPEEDQKQVRRDFHGRCIVRLVRENLNVYAEEQEPRP